MKKFLFPALTAILMLVSCNDNNEAGTVDNGVESLLSIQTEISTMNTALRSAGPLSSFPEGSQLSLWATPGTLGTNYDVAPYNNVLAELKSGKWELTPPVKLSDTPAVIYGFYPYKSDYTNGRDNMNVYHADQVDYMFGTNAEGQQDINRENPNVRLGMKHALSLLQFRVKKMNYTGQAKLTRVEVANAVNKQDLRSGATLNISNGELTYLGSHHSAAVAEDINGMVTLRDEFPADDKDIVNVMVLPLREQTTAAGNILIKFTVDAQTYTYSVPMNTIWKQGTKYIYDVTLNGTELIIDDITITDWLDGPVTPVELF